VGFEMATLSTKLKLKSLLFYQFIFTILFYRKEDKLALNQTKVSVLPKS